jgi:hypothetical protein
MQPSVAAVSISDDCFVAFGVRHKIVLSEYYFWQTSHQELKTAALVANGYASEDCEVLGLINWRFSTVTGCSPHSCQDILLSSSPAALPSSDT